MILFRSLSTYILISKCWEKILKECCYASALDWLGKSGSIIDTALEEDIGEGDVITNTLFDESETASAYLMSKATGIVAGLNIAEQVFGDWTLVIIWMAQHRRGR